jgi:hypothetical protein
MAYTNASAASLLRESMGSTTLHIATFAAGGSLSWNSGLPNAVAWWAATGSGQGCGITTAYSSSTSGVTFYMTGAGAGAVADDVYRLFVLSRT